jgi:hypothetical protein
MATIRRLAVMGAFGCVVAATAMPVTPVLASPRIAAAPLAWPPSSLPTTVTQIVPNPVAPLGSVYLSFECDAASTGQFVRVVDSGQFFGAPNLFPSDPLPGAATRIVGAVIGVVELAPAGAVASIESYCVDRGRRRPLPDPTYAGRVPCHRS